MKFGEWTLTEKELPPEPKKLYESDSYLCTIDNNNVVAMKYVKTTVRNKEVVRWEWNGRIPIWNVIAYMPFPKPYHEQSR